MPAPASCWLPPKEALVEIVAILTLIVTTIYTAAFILFELFKR